MIKSSLFLSVWSLICLWAGLLSPIPFFSVPIGMGIFVSLAIIWFFGVIVIVELTVT